MWKKFRQTFFFLILLGLLACSGNGLETLDLKVFNNSGELLANFEVEVADDGAERTQGLMFRQEMAEDRGMLFIFEEERMGSFWMRNTLISLDIIFVDAQKRVINVVENAEPLTDTPRSPEGPYLYVLEINGGLAQAYGIGPGSVLQW